MSVHRYGAEYYGEVADSAARAAAVVVPLVVGLLAPQSVVDVGCGTGAWGAEFAARGAADVWGVDGGDVDVGALRIPESRFVRHDLTAPLDLGRRFDLAVCLEVAEHLPAEAADVVVATLARHAPAVLFSAAVPHQGGVSHVNEQWPEYWAERFAGHGMVPLDPLRRRVWDDRRVAWWYAQNLLLYVSADVLARRGDALPAPEPGPPPALIHPVRYLEWVRWAEETPRDGE